MNEKLESTADVKAALKAEFDRPRRREVRKSVPLKERMNLPRRRMARCAARVAAAEIDRYLRKKKSCESSGERCHGTT